MARVSDLRRLNDAVARAVAERNRPLEPGEESRQLFALPDYLDEAGTRALWSTIEKLGDEAPEIRNEFVGDHMLLWLIVDLVAEHGGPVDWPTLCSLLRDYADSDRDWIVAMPLANVLPPTAYVELATTAGLARTTQEKDWKPGTLGGDNDTRPSSSRIRNHLGDYVMLGARWRPEGQRLGPLDTRHTASLLLVEGGTESIALERAFSRARYVLALWCLLRPPPHRELWPAIADWTPRPFLKDGIVRKPFEPDKWTGRAREHGRDLTEYLPYELPDDDELLRAPMEILDAATDHPAARAVVSGAWALHLAERTPNDLQRTDELIHLHAAIEAICDLGQLVGQTGAPLAPDPRVTEAEDRWRRITERLGVWRSMRKHYAQGEVESAKKLAEALRHIAVHGADDVLVNLGYPGDRQRQLRGGQVLSGEQLAIARVAGAGPVLRQAVREVIEHVAREGPQHGWADAWFHGLFEVRADST